MNDDLRALLRDADGGAVRDGDLAAGVARARATRTTRGAMIMLLAALGTGAVLATSAGILDEDSQVAFTEPGQPSEHLAADREGDGAEPGGAADGGPSESEPDEESPPAAPGCELPALRPTMLPWVADGEEVPDPDESRRHEDGALLAWLGDDDAMAPDGEAWHGPTVSVSRTVESDLGLGTHGREVEIRGQPGEVRWVGDLGVGQMGVRWREEPGPCGLYAVSLLTSGEWEAFFDPPLADCTELTQEACLDLVMPRFEELAVDIAESLVETDEETSGDVGVTDEQDSVEGGLNDAQRLARALEAHLLELLDEAGFSRLDGSVHGTAASHRVELEGGARVSSSLRMTGLAERGGITFEQAAAEQIGDVTLEFGEASNEQAAAQFDCGDYQFRFRGDDDAAVHHVAGTIALAATCPYEPEVTAGS